MSELDKDFEGLVEQINAKLAEAAKALSEANELRSKAGFDSFIFSAWKRDDAYREIRNRIDEAGRDPDDGDEVYDEIEKIQSQYEKFDVRALEDALGDGGWSTSSSYC